MKYVKLLGLLLCAYVCLPFYIFAFSKPAYEIVSVGIKHASYDAAIVTRKDKVKLVTHCYPSWSTNAEIYGFIPTLLIPHLECSGNVQTDYDVYAFNAENNALAKKSTFSETHSTMIYPGLQKTGYVSIKAWDDSNKVYLSQYSDMGVQLSKSKNYVADLTKNTISTITAIPASATEIHEHRDSGLGYEKMCLRRWINDMSPDGTPQFQMQKMKMPFHNNECTRQVDGNEHSFITENCIPGMDLLTDLVGIAKKQFIIFDNNGDLIINSNATSYTPAALYCD